MNRLLISAIIMMAVLAGAVSAQTTTFSDISSTFIDGFVSVKNTLLGDPDLGSSVKDLFTNLNLKKVNYAQASAEAKKIADDARSLQARIDTLRKSAGEKSEPAANKIYGWNDDII